MVREDLISVVLTTYNRPDALRAVLEGLFAQVDKHFEILIADDGSTEQTTRLIEESMSQTSIPMVHVWQEDLGFRAGAARNRAVAQAAGSYILFLDGDCIPRPDFISLHRSLAEPGWMVAGNRILLSEEFTNRALAENLPIHSWPISRWIECRRIGAVNRILPLFSLPLGPIRRFGSQKWQRVRSCNLGLWARDFALVNGFDELYEGWGFEDSDLAARLLNIGVRRKDGAFATGVLHLWHRENDRRFEGANLARLKQRLDSGTSRIEYGLDQYLNSRP
jgi:glycosyltransferase involved in cell wall biosynthesis